MLLMLFTIHLEILHLLLLLVRFVLHGNFHLFFLFASKPPLSRIPIASETPNASATLTEENNVFDGIYSTNEYPTKHRRKWMPILAYFVVEIKRRKVLMGQNPKANSQMKVAAALNWLDYVLSQMRTFMNASSNLVVTVDSSPKSKHWKGSLSFLRLIHCLVDNDEVK